MDLIIALLIFFIFLYILEKITEKTEQKQELEEEMQENEFVDNCPYCRSKVKYQEPTCGNCQQQLKWE